MTPLDESDHRLLAAIYGYRRRNGFRCPKHSDLRRLTGFKSTKLIYRLGKLRSHGLVTWEPQSRGTIRLTAKGIMAAQGYEGVL